MSGVDIEEGGLPNTTKSRRCNTCRCQFLNSVSLIYNCCVVALALLLFIVLIFQCKDYVKVVLLWLENQEHWTIYFIYVGLFTLVSFPFVWGYTFLVISCGYLFGIIRGISTVIIAANVGVAIAHLLMRRFYTRLPLSNAILNNDKVTAILNVISGQNAFKVTAFARVTPIPFGIQNIIFAISSINSREYFVSSFVGLLPAQCIYVYIGSSLRSMEDVLSNKSTGATGFIVLIQIAILVAVLFYIVAKARKELNKTLAGASLTRIYCELSLVMNASVEPPKREENPFSFKHFLRRDTASVHGTGARPKVYGNLSSDAGFSRLEPPDSASAQPSSPPELASILPDFVQDHLVIEQCYLGQADHSDINLDHLPDFAYSEEGGASLWGKGRPECRVSEVRDERDGEVRVMDISETPLDLPAGGSSRQNFDVGLPFDLPRVLRGEPPLDLPCGGAGGLPFDLPRVRGETPLDLPSSSSSSRGGGGGGMPFDLPSPTQTGLPFDLPRVRGETPLDLPCGGAGGLPFDLPLGGAAYGGDGGAVQGAGETAVPQSLPDFLSDGPMIHSGLVGEAAQPGVESPDSTCPSPPPQGEPERLRRELETSRRRVLALERELAALRCKDQEELVTLEKAIEQVEDNLKRSTRRAVTAENTVSKLKQEMKSLMSEVTSLRQENRTLRHSCAGAGAGPSGGGAFTQDELHAQRIAQDLRQAANTAERSLRTLISGVGNLRAIAGSLDAITRTHDRTPPPPDCGVQGGEEEDEEMGPTL